MARNLAAEVFAERVNFGGLCATRVQVFNHVLECALSRGAHRKAAVKCAEWSAMFGYRRLLDSETEQMVKFDPSLHG